VLLRFGHVFDNLVDLGISKERGSSGSSNPRALRRVVL
jgi:hypothetical protein